MKRNVSRIVAPLFAVMLSAGCTSESDTSSAGSPSIDPATEILDKHMAFFDRVNAPGCSIVLTSRGEVLAAKAYGMANLDYDIPLATDTTFRIASVSKQFTAMAVMLLAEDGKLSLDEDIHSYIPELPDYGHKITLRQMLEHSSGMPTYEDVGYLTGSTPDYILAAEGEETEYYQYPFMSASGLLANTLKADKLHRKPGEKWEYNNIAYFLAGVAVERVSGQHLRDFAAERIFKPLGMDSTFFQTENYVPVKGRADGYYRMKDGRFIEWPTDLNWIGDGGLFTTVEDLAKWDRNFYDNQLGGGQALIDEYVRPNTDLEYPDWEKHPGQAGAAMGTYTSITDFGPVVQHGGSWVGFRTYSTRHMESGYGVYMLCNTNEASSRMPAIPNAIIKDALEMQMKAG